MDPVERNLLDFFVTAEEFDAMTLFEREEHVNRIVGLHHEAERHRIGGEAVRPEGVSDAG